MAASAGMNIVWVSVASLGPSTKRWMVWGGRVLTALPVVGLTMSAAMKFAGPAEVAQTFTGKFGYPAGLLLALGIVELVCTALYAFPRTAVLGAILVTGYLGGAVATHVRVSEGFASPLLLGVLVWAGLFLRDERIRALLPWRK